MLGQLQIGAGYKMLSLPVPMPSLKVAWVHLPSSMSEAEFLAILMGMEMYREALVESETDEATANSASRERG